MRAVALVVVAALMSVATAQIVGQCTGWNVTMHIGLQPKGSVNPDATQTQICPFGYFPDTTQGGRCITFRQAINNYFGAPCYTNDDCTGASVIPSTSTILLPLGCGRDKTCTWSGTRAKGDSCTDNINCGSYPALNGSTVAMGCSKESKTCDIYTHVVVSTNARCNYTDGNQRFICDDANTCKFYSTPAAQNPVFGAGYCTPLRAINEQCIGKLPEQTFANLWCANKKACFGFNPANRTCQEPVKEGGTCYTYGTEYDCDQTGANKLYCNGVSKTCVQYTAAGGNCTGNYLSNSQTGNLCQMGLRCYTVFGDTKTTCNAPSPVTGPCSIGGVNTGANCTTGLQCITQPVRGQITYQCSAGANGDICQIYNSVPVVGQLTDSCQPGLFCQQYAPANYTCVPKFTTGTFCNSSMQCQDGIACVNSTCTAFQTLGQPCNELTTNPLNYLRCNPSLQCSRGVCINNYTVPLNGYCTQDRDCENAHCDVVLKRCTRRKLCSDDSMCPQGTCACSAGVENMGQCILNTCGKPSFALRTCLNPLIYDLYSNSTYYNDANLSPMEASYSKGQAFFLDSGSSFYTKCSSQHADYVRCRGMMAKWGAPAVPLGDFINYDLATISASSSVTVSFVAMIAFVMTIFMNL